MFFVFQEIPGNLYFQKTSEKWLKSGKIEKISPLLFLQLLKLLEYSSHQAILSTLIIEKKINAIFLKSPCIAKKLEI